MTNSSNKQEILVYGFLIVLIVGAVIFIHQYRSRINAKGNTNTQQKNEDISRILLYHNDNYTYKITQKNDYITNNPYNALCSHGTEGAMVQTRIALVLDIETNLPVWFHIFASCVLDHSTIMTIAKDIKASIDVDILDSILDGKKL